MKKQKLYKFAIITGVIGLIIILSIVLSGTAYPNLFFSIGTLAGLIFIFASVVLLFISWSKDVYDAVKRKQYLLAILIAIFGLIIVIRLLIKA